MGNAGGVVDKQGRIGGGLNVSRAFGDFSYKERQDLLPEQQKVVAVPEVKEFTIEEADEFVVLASDGVYDVSTSEQLVAQLRSALEKGQELEETVKAALEKATDSGDNVSICLVRLNRLTK